MIKAKKHNTTEVVSGGANRARALNIAKIIGMNIRQRRLALDLTMEELGNLLNLSFQQMQKYETGKNVPSSVQLYDLSSVLNIPMSNFFYGVANEEKIEVAGLEISSGALSAKEAHKILRAFSAIPE